MIIAIDGPVGSGKSSAARRVAALLGYTYLDSGAMYRALALKALQRGIAFDAAEQLEALAAETRIDLRAAAWGQQVFLDGEDVTAEIRTEEVSQSTSKISVHSGVRTYLVAEQRRAGAAGG
ncbi:MAG: (d)CMP kinase, partial [Acidobacteria bacterium]|nr:(d)CMP kinase [Acidobacteriota bacterium]